MPVKSCPSCSKQSHVRVLKCQCGFQFREPSKNSKDDSGGTRKSFPPSSEIQSVVDQLESQKTYQSRRALYHDVAMRLDINANTLATRIGELGINLKTEPGALKPPQDRKSRREKFKNYTTYDVAKKRLPEEMHDIVNRAAQGDPKAAIKIFCLECVGLDREEVRNCTSTGCILYPLRPYKTNKEKYEE